MVRIKAAWRQLIIGSALTFALSSTALAQSAEPPTIYHGGSILTMEGNAPTYVDAIVVENGKIVFAGSAAKAMRKKRSNTRIQDLDGKTLLPGFIDSHSHFIDSLILTERVNVSAPPVGVSSSPTEIIATLQKEAAQKGLKPGELLLGWGYDENLMPEGQMLSRDILDEAFPDNPVGIFHVSMHGAVINSKAMELYGYQDGMKTPEGGIILRKPGTQDLQGLVMESGYHLMYSNLPTLSVDREIEAARAGQMLYAASGITTAQEGASTLPTIQRLQRLAAQNALFIDVIAYPVIMDGDGILEDNPPTTFGHYNNGLKLGGCKVVVDGSPQAKTAWFTTPYLTGGPDGQKGWTGEPSMPIEVVRKMVQTCYDNNLQTLIHGNGDAAIDFLIATHKDAAAKDITKDRRTVCIHCQFVRPDQLSEMAELNIIPSLFIGHNFFFADTHILNRGVEQAAFISPMKAAIEAGLRPTNHTDAFVVPVDQMMVLWSAVNRELRSGGINGKEQRVTPYQALQAITINAAHQYREEASKGSITVGKRADFVVLSADPTKIAPQDIKDIKVLETIKDGRQIYLHP